MTVVSDINNEQLAEVHARWLSESNKLKASHVLWLGENNITEYRARNQPAPAELEVSAIAEAEIERVQRRFMHDYGVNIYDAPDQELVQRWLPEQVPTNSFYEALDELMRIYNINQIVSILEHLLTPGVVTLRTTIVSESSYSVTFVYRQML